MGENARLLKLQRNRGRYYRKISVSIFCALFSIIVVFCAGLFAFAANDARHRNVEEDAAAVDQALASLTYINNSANSVCQRISESASIVSLLEKEAPQDENALYEAIRLMSKTKQSIIDIHEFIASLAVYSQRAGRIYSSINGINYQDPELLAMLEMEQFPVDQPVFRSILVKNSMKNVLTFGKIETDMSDVLRSVVFVNVDVQWLEQDLRQAFGSSELESGALIILNSQGQIVASVGQAESLEPRLLDNCEVSYEKVEIDGRHYYLTAGYHNGTGMQVLRLRSLESMDGYIWTYVAMALGVLLAAAVVSIFLSAMITRIIYEPIGVLAQKINSNSQNMDEIHVLNSAYTSLGDTRAALLEAQKTEKLYTLLRSDPESTPNIDIPNLQIDAYRPVTLVLFRMDLNSGQEPRKALEQLTGQVEEQFSVESVQMDFLTTACVVQTAALSSRKELIAALEEQSSLYTAANYAVGVSGRIPDLTSLPGAYKEALNAVGKRFFYGDRAVLPAEQVLGEQRNIWQDHAEVFRAEEQMLSDIKNGRMKELEQHLDEYLNLYYGYAHTELIFFQSHLICSVNTLINQINQLRMRPILLNISQMDEEQAACTTIRQLRTVLLHYMKQLCCQTQTSTEDKHAAVVEMVKGIIREEYADPGLCLASISTRVNLSPNYVGRIFKYATNLSVSAFINEVRLQHAVDWIEHSNIKVNLILEKVGFTNQSSFYKSFKQKYGIAPKEYALKARKENESSQEND